MIDLNNYTAFDMNSNNMGSPESSSLDGARQAEKAEGSLGESQENEVSVEELTRFLEENGVDTSAWGTGEAKTVRDLFEEVREGESQLSDSEEGLRRVTSVAFIEVLYKDKDGRIFRLVEESQVFSDGRKRKRKLPEGSIGEKIKVGEDPADCAVRGVQEELGIEIDRGRLMDLGHKFSVKPSPSYPGLDTRYTSHIFRVTFTDAEFNPGGYTEDDGKKVTTFIWEEIDK